MGEPAYSRDPVPLRYAELLWRVLVEECRARDDERDRGSFIRYVTEPNQFGHEWRFMGALGVGGKFYNDHFSWRVGCYPEDRSPERDEMIRRANERLAAMRAQWIEGEP